MLPIVHVGDIGAAQVQPLALHVSCKRDCLAR